MAGLSGRLRSRLPARRKTFPGQTNAGSVDAFVRKYRADGAIVWTSQFGTSLADLPFVNGIASHSSGIYVVGNTLGTFPGEPAGAGIDIFLARLEPATGAVAWVRQFGVRTPFPSSYLELGGVAVDDTGVYVATTLELPGGTSFLPVLRKYDFAGHRVWSRELPSTLDCFADFRDVAAFAGRAYVVGQWEEAYLTAPGTCGKANSGAEGGPVIGVLQAYDPGGSVLWTRGIKAGARTGKDAFTGAKRVTASPAGIFVAANNESSFPGHPPGGPSSDHSDCQGLGSGHAGTFFDRLDAYVRRYDFAGDVLWTHQFGSVDFDLVIGLAADGASVNVVGDTSCQIADGTTFFGGTRDTFVLRMAADPTSPSGLTELLVGELETLDDQGRFTPGEFDSLVQTLEAALSAIGRGGAGDARQALAAFIGEVEAQRGRGTLSSAEAARLIAGANQVIAQLG